MHESAKDDKSIRNPDGQRLKLDDPSLSSSEISRRRPKPPPPKFNLTFADLGDSQSASQYRLPASDDDDDDLPNIHDLLNAHRSSDVTAKQKSSSASDYSNSEIDALIRDIPLVDFEAELASDSHLPSDFDSLRPNRSVTPLPSRKRHRESENERPAKRFDRFSDTVSARTPSPPPTSPPRKARFYSVFSTPSLIVFPRECKTRRLCF